MDSSNVSRRDFLRTATVVGAAALAAGPLLNVVAAESSAPAPMSIYICSVCGHIEFGVAPDYCPVCHSPKDKFSQNNTVFTDAEAKNKSLAIGHVPVVIAKKQSSLIPEAPTQEVTVRVGKKLHPMEQTHFIRFIDCYVDDKYVSRSMLTIGEHPAAVFYAKAIGTKVRVVELCNLHGYWQTEATVV